MDIHFLHCVHGNEHIKTHDAIHDTFVIIEWDANFHVGRKQLYVFPSTTFNSFRQWIDIVLTKDGIHTLANIIIVNSMQANLFSRSCTTQGFATSDITQAKERSYHNRQPTYQFLPLAIEVFGCLHKHIDVFLHDCANAIWSLKGTKKPSSFYLGNFFLSIFFYHITKYISIFHLKSSDSHRLSYFPTSTPSKHTSHHHGRPIASHWFLTCKYGQPSTPNWLWTYIDFQSNFEPTWRLVLILFSLILLLCTFP